MVLERACLHTISSSGPVPETLHPKPYFVVQVGATAVSNSSEGYLMSRVVLA